MRWHRCLGLALPRCNSLRPLSRRTTRSVEMIHVITAVLGLAPSGPLHHALAFEGATLAAVGAARRITEPHEAQFRRDRAVVLRGIHSCGLSPLKKLGDPQPSEMDGVDAEMRIAAALVSRLLGAAFLRDPCGSWCGGWDNAYDHYSYWRILDQFPPETRAMVVLPREPMTVTLCGYPVRVRVRVRVRSGSGSGLGLV